MEYHRTVRDISNLLVGEPLKIAVFYRLGKEPKENNSRPIVVITESKEQRKSILEKARSIKTRLHDHLKSTAIARDLTQLQREGKKAANERRVGKIRADSEQNEQMPIGPTQATGEGSQA